MNKIEKHSCLEHMHTIHDLPCYFFKYLDVEERAQFENERREIILNSQRFLEHELVVLMEKWSHPITERFNKESLIVSITKIKQPKSELEFDLEKLSLSELWSIYSALIDENSKLNESTKKDKPE